MSFTAQPPTSDSGDPLDHLLNNLIADQIAQLYQRTHAQGHGGDSEYRETLIRESWLMIVQLLQDRYDDLWPDQDMLVPVLVHVLQCEETEAAALCQQFKLKGWLDQECQPTEQGLQLGKPQHETA